MAETEQTVEAEPERTQRAIQHVSEMWVEMSKTEPFQLMLAELERMGTRYRQLRFDAMMRGEAIDQREVDYERGLISGLQRPAMIIRTAETAIQKSDHETEADEEDEEVKFW